MSTTARLQFPADHEQAAVPPEALFRLSVNQYHEMIRAGILSDDDHVELLEGWLVGKMSKNPPHRVATNLTSDALRRLLPAGWYVDTQEPFTTDTSEPEPDVAVVRGRTRDYLDRHPGPADIALTVEITDLSLNRDRGIKRQIYERAGIAMFWIVNLIERNVEVYTRPAEPEKQVGYKPAKVYGESDLVPVVIEGQEVGTVLIRDILP